MRVEERKTMQAVVRRLAPDGGTSLVPDTGSGRLEPMLLLHRHSGRAGSLIVQLRVAELPMARGDRRA